MKVDLAIKRGTLATPEGCFDSDLYIQDGRILAVGRLEELEAQKTIDAQGLVVMPGAVDGHVHIMDPGHTDREDFATGTAAAAVGGATTVIEHHRTEPPVLNAARGWAAQPQEPVAADFLEPAQTGTPPLVENSLFLYII